MSLDAPDAEDPWAVLSPDERDRAGRFLRPIHRDRYAAGRAWLRRVLAGYLGRSPSEIAFAYGQHEKPALAGGPGWLDFNLAHSEEHALLAVSPGFPVGVDIEVLRPVDEKLPQRFFAPGEVAALAALPAAARQAAFFRCWTRKEAYLKALGSGLATPLDAFEVTLGPGEAARLLRVAGKPDEAAAWQMLHWEPEGQLPRRMGAVAARRRGWRLVEMGSGGAGPP